MFQNYVDAKAEKRRGWLSIFITISIAVHVIGLAALLIYNYTQISLLELPDSQITLAAPPPPPPPPPPASETPDRTPDEVVREVDTTVQPDPEREIPDEVVTQEEVVGIEGGIEGGVAGGSLGGVQGGVVGSGDPPPPAPPSEPKNVDPGELTRVAGTRDIHPDGRTQTRIDRDGRSRVTARVRMCLTPSGSVESLNMLDSTGYSAYDDKILSEMRRWQYQLEEAVPVCTTIQFRYNLQAR